MTPIAFKKCDEKATIPERATPGSAGFDLYAMSHHEIWPGAQAMIRTGIACAIPEGYAGFVWPRSGLSVRYGITNLAGLIDSDYRHEVHVVLINHGQRLFEVRPGERIAQMVVGPHLCHSIEVEDLPDPGTRFGGFGSTGA